jgi:hypothetical protein
MFFVVSETSGQWGYPRPVDNVVDRNSTTNDVTAACAGVNECTIAGTGTLVSVVGITVGSGIFTADVVAGNITAVQSLPTLAKNPQVDSISCPSVGDCVVSGRNNVSVPDAFIVSETSHLWGTTLRTIPNVGTLDAQHDLGPTSVSCSSLNNCVVIGRYGSAPLHVATFVAKEVAGAWSNAQPVAGLSVVGTDTVDPASLLTCPTAGNCLIVGQSSLNASDQHTYVAKETAGTWSPAVELPGVTGLGNGSFDWPVAVSCTTTFQCAIVGDAVTSSGGVVAYATLGSPGSWGSATIPSGLTSLDVGQIGLLPGVSCASGGPCVAVGAYDSAGLNDSEPINQAYIITSSGSSWSSVVADSGTDVLSNAGSSTADVIDCPSSGDCVAAGTYNVGRGAPWVASESGGNWAPAAKLPVSYSDISRGVTVVSISCADAADCALVGKFSPASGGDVPYVADESSGSWGTATDLPGYTALNKPGTGSEATQVRSVSCGGAGDCVVVGDYLDAGGHEQAYLAEEISGTWGSVEAIPGLTSLSATASFAVQVSCPDAGDCVIVGSYSTDSSSNIPFTEAESAGTWGNAAALSGVTLPAFASGVSCPVAGDCALTGTENTSATSAGFVADEISGSWGAPSSISGFGPDSISCPTVGNCAVVGGVASDKLAVDEEISGTWGSPATVSGSGSLIQALVAPIIGCSSPGNCALTDDASGTAQVAYETNYAWTSAVAPPSASRFGLQLNDLACAPGAECVTVGTSFDGVGDQQAVMSLDGHVPEAPTEVVAATDEAALDVSWSAPNVIGSSAITAYVATATLGQQSLTCTAHGYGYTPLNCIIQGLQDATQYSVSVTAENAYGQSVPSDAVEGTTLALPGPPTAVQVVPSNGQVSVSWTAPVDDGGGGGSYLDYVVTASPGGVTCETDYSLSCTVKHLNPLVAYQFRVVANNVLGPSAPTPSTGAVYPFGGTSLALESIGVAAKGTATKFIVTSAAPGSSVRVFAPGALPKTCVATSHGQCTVSLVEIAYGVAQVTAAQGLTHVSSTLRVPRNNIPATVVHGRLTVFTVSFCPVASTVWLNFSDGAKSLAWVRGGIGTATVKLPRAGSVTLSTVVAGVHLTPQVFIVK